MVFVVWRKKCFFEIKKNLMEMFYYKIVNIRIYIKFV